jgi:Uma2 family endonuclease
MTALAKPRETIDEVRLLLHGVSWGTYERLLAEHTESAGPRFTYDNGFLEIMTLSLEHEQPNRRLASLVELILGEWDIDFEHAGSNTFKRPDLAKGFEPDSCFYIRKPKAVRGRKRLVLPADPAPDLVLEVEVTAPLLPRLPIFAAMGVREIWQCDGSAVAVLVLDGATYREQPASVMLPGLTAARITKFLQMASKMTSPTWMRRVRTWAQAHRP